MIEKGSTYVYGTAAEKIEYDVYQHNEVLKNKKKIRTNNKTKVKVVFTLLLIFAMFSLIMYRYSMITELNYDIAKTEKNYDKIKDENARLLVQIENETDLKKIKEVAINELGMQIPNKMQTIHISVDKKDFTVVAKEYQDIKQENKSKLPEIFDKASKLIQLLY